MLGRHFRFFGRLRPNFASGHFLPEPVSGNRHICMWVWCPFSEPRPSCLPFTRCKRCAILNVNSHGYDFRSRMTGNKFSSYASRQQFPTAIEFRIFRQSYNDHAVPDRIVSLTRCPGPTRFFDYNLLHFVTPITQAHRSTPPRASPSPLCLFLV